MLAVVSLRVFLCWIYLRLAFGLPTSTFVQFCQRDCENGLIALPLKGKHFGDCNWNCRINECAGACRNYSYDATQPDTCFANCRVNNRTAACDGGCVDANIQLLNYIKGTVTSAQLISNAQTSSKTEMTWKLTDAMTDIGIIWKVQFRRKMLNNYSSNHNFFANQQNGAWESFPSTIGITGAAVLNVAIAGHLLRTNATYDVRLTAYLRNRLVATSITATITTVVGNSAPERPRLAVMDNNTSVNEKIICWDQSSGSYAHNFTVSIALNTTPHKILESQTVSTQCYALRNISPGEIYKVTVTSRNQFSTSEPSETIISIPEAEQVINLEESNYQPLYVANRTQVVRLDDRNDYLLSRFTVCYKAKKPDEILAITAVGSKLYIALSGGNIVTYEEKNGKANITVIYHLTSSTHQVTTISVNWFTEDVYLSAGNQVILCQKSNSSCSSHPMFSPSQTIAGLVVEPRMGFIYLTTSTGLYSASMTNLSQIALLKDFEQNNSQLSVSLDSSFNFLLYVSLNSTLYQYDLLTKLTNATTGVDGNFANVSKLIAIDQQVYWISHPCEKSGSYCLFGSKRMRADNAISSKNSMSIKFLWDKSYGTLVDLTAPIQEAYPILLPPTNVQALFPDESIRITWSPPKNLPFQATNIAIPYRYMVNLQFDNKSVAFQPINDSRFEVIFKKIKARTAYTIVIKTCWRDKCSDEVTVTGKTMAPANLLKNVRVVIGSSNKSVGTYNMVGNFLDSFGSAPSTREIRWIDSVSPNGDHLALDSENCLFYINSDKEWSPMPFSRCGDPSAFNVTCFQFEPLGEMIYWCDSNGIFRCQMGSLSYKQISADANVQTLSLLRSEALAIIHQTGLVYGIQLTGAYYRQYYSCVANDCEVIGACTYLGVGAGRVYMLVTFRDRGRTELHTSLSDGSDSDILGFTNATLNIKTMEYFYGKFLLFMEDGRLAIVESDLTAINYFPMQDIAAFAVLDAGSISDVKPSVNITTANVASTNLGSMLFTWSTNLSSQSTHPLLFNVTISPVLEEQNNTSVFVQTLVDFQVLDTDFVPANEKVDITIIAFDYWKSHLPFTKRLTTPSAPPSPPRNPRLYTDHVQSPYNTTASVTFIWDNPRWNGVAQSFNVSCWSQKTKPLLVEQPLKSKFQSGAQQKLILQRQLDPNIHFFVLPNLTLGDLLLCQVAATIIGKITGKPTNLISVNTSELSPSPLAIISKNDGLYLFDTDRDALIKNLSNGNFISSVELGGSVFALRGDGKLVQSTGSYDNFQTVNLGNDISYHLITIDWIGRNLFMVGSNANTLGKGDGIWKYNLDIGDGAQPVYTLAAGEKIKDIVFDPYRNLLYLTTSDGKQLMLQQITLSTMELYSHVPNCGLISTAIATDIVWKENLTVSITPYAITDNGVVDALTCSPLVNVTSNISLQSVRDMTFQKDDVILITDNDIYLLDKLTGVMSQLKSAGRVNNIYSVSPGKQLLPDISCLLTPLDSKVDFRIYPINTTAAQVEIDTSPIDIIPQANCSNDISLPETIYVVFICELLPILHHAANKCINVETYAKKKIITGLLENVQYNVYVDKRNFYGTINNSASQSQTFNTSQTLHLSPAKLKARPVTPDSVVLYWEQSDVFLMSKNQMKYKVTALSPARVKVQEQEDISCSSTKCQYIVNGLKPNSSYIFRVGPSGDKRPSELEMNKNEAIAKTFTSPGTLISINSNFTFDSLALVWQPLEDARVRHWVIQYTRVAEDNWQDVMSDVTTSNSSSMHIVRITNLRPLTQYRIRLMIFYDTGYNYTEENVFITRGMRRPRQKGSTPGAPIKLGIEERQKGQRYLVWKEPDDGGLQIKRYVVEQRNDAKSDWSLVANNIPGNQEEWMIYNTVPVSATTEFRLAAENVQGRGPWATVSAQSLFGSSSALSKTVIIIIVVVVIVVIFLIVGTILFACRRRLCKNKNATGGQGFQNLSRPLPGYRSGNNASHLDALSQISKDDLDALPHVSRNCITPSTPLGQGAFGEVYEGLACNLPRIGPKTVRVAIKTLKEGSPDIERVKFLKEAILMSKFHHPNIVNLLGVCLESEPHWIILELMEGGDLLTYLRLARPTETMPSQVTLEDLLTLAIDVARGCSHLEQHHHVHRDLAGRNCLLSSRDPTQRVVKIGDFGMARDVYEGDYYRVEGHGLLPVRWMAPESMIDGVFTTKTDVWSFGVLLWEILTLGHQPYPGRTNWDVMNYVRIGGRLKQPDFCPDQLYEIMNSCWAFEAKDRPSFTGIVDRLESLRSLPQFRSANPFPPFYPGSSFSTDSRESSNAAILPGPSQGQIQLFVTQASGRFQKDSKDTQSSKAKKFHKAAEFLSFRKHKETQPPPPPPSKDEINPSRTPSSLHVPTVAARGTSGDSFTTNVEGYEIPLVKNVAKMGSGFTNRAYEPTSPESPAAGPSIASSLDTETRYIVPVKSGGPASGSRPQSPQKQAVAISGVRIKPNAPKPPLKPEVVQLSSSPQSARRNSPERPQASASYENYQPDSSKL